MWAGPYRPHKVVAVCTFLSTFGGWKVLPPLRGGGRPDSATIGGGGKALSLPPSVEDTSTLVEVWRLHYVETSTFGGIFTFGE